MQKSWDLREILPKINSKEYNNLNAELEKNTAFIESYKNKLNPNISPDEILKIIKAEEKITEIGSRFSAYAGLKFYENTSDQKAQSFMSSIEHIFVNINNRIMFFSLWFKALDNKDADRIINSIPSEYKYYFERIRTYKPHTLSESEEKIVNIKDVTGMSALIKLYEIITNNFVFNLNLNGKHKKLTRDQLSQYVKSTKKIERKTAYQELYRIYSIHSNVLGEIYRNIVLDLKSETINLRKYETPISFRNLSNDVSDKSVKTLLNVCRKNRKIFQDYFKLKSKICHIKNMERYDIYTHYGYSDKKYSYGDAKEIVFSAYKNYSEEMYELASDIVKKNHVDYEIRKNKYSGAFCMNITPKICPYVLLNFNGNIRDLFTIAHEFGHAVHDSLASKNSILTANPPLVLAETASVFGEMLLFEDLIKKIKNKELKKSLLINRLDDCYATIIRQTYFVLFEIEAHDMINNGASIDDLNRAYLKNLREQFGNSIKISDEFKYEWTSIPHIYHSPFYCYSYVFGNLLVLALYEKYRKEGKPFVSKYLNILRYGGSEKPFKILKEVGVNIEDEKFWQGGFDLVSEMINDLKKL